MFFFSFPYKINDFHILTEYNSMPFHLFIYFILHVILRHTHTQGHTYIYTHRQMTKDGNEIKKTQRNDTNTLERLPEPEKCFDLFPRRQMVRPKLRTTRPNSFASYWRVCVFGVVPNETNKSISVNGEKVIGFRRLPGRIGTE